MKVTPRRAVLASLAAIALAAALVGAAAARQSTSQATTITFWQTMNTQETETLKDLVSRFESSHPEIKVEMTYVDFGNHVQKFTTAAQAGQGPDVMRADTAPDVAGWAAQGLLTDLTPLVSARAKKDFVQAAISGAQYRGKLWAVPQTVDALALFYNKRMLAAKGLKAPPATLSQLVQYCQKFGAAQGIALQANGYWIQPWIWGYGGGLVSVAKKEIYVASKLSIAGIAAYNRLFHNKCATSNRDFSNEYGNMMTAFKNGKVAMIVNGPWSTADVLSGPAFKRSTNFQVATIPRGPGGQGSPIGGASFVISRNSKQAKEAATFINWLTAPAQQAIFADKNNLLPSRVSAYALPVVKKNRIIVQFLAQMKKATDRSAGPQGGQIYTDFTPAVQRLLSGKLSAAAAARSIASSWESKLFPGYKVVK
ncbi:MAG: extracellular solute-binding protein [Gaiellaceae bacterium MAG52_C11]|nr:extracellular solute-binding protein [Candidatus Gaiellasilicea maunaloa]